MADTSIVYDVVAHDHATAKINKVRAATKLLVVAAGALALKFGKDSVGAFVEAQEAQKRLGDAFSRFPKLADTNIDRLRALNTTLAQKTKFDDDAFASGQAVLAQFGVTGKQLEDMTPLLADYASKTGKDLPSAAQDLGKALLGNAKALKNIGIKYTATGDSVKDFNNIQALMRKQVGGFAEKEGKTAAGQAAILKNQFGELEEGVGGALVPVLMSLGHVLLSVVGFMQRHSTVMKIAITTIAALTAGIYALIVAQRIGAFLSKQQAEQTILYTVAQKIAAAASKAWAAAQWLVNAALTANPIGLVIAAIALLVVGMVIAYKKSETFRAVVQAAMKGVLVAFGWVKDAGKALWDFMKKVWNGIGNAVRAGIVFILGKIDLFLGGLETLVGFMAKLPGPLGAPFKAAQGAIQGAREKIWKLQGDLRGIKSPPPLHVSVVGWREAVAHLAAVAYAARGVPLAATYNAQNRTRANDPGRAMGGPVWPGMAYTVGERGPETFVPSVAGRIEPRVSGIPGGGSMTSRADLDYLAGRIGEVVLAGISAALVGTARRSDRLTRGG